MSARRARRGGSALIIVVFMIMLLGGLGWSLAMIASSGFDANLRLFDSEKAMYAALAGQSWAMNMLEANGLWRTDNGDNACTQASDWVTHSLPGAQYQVCCRNSVGAEQTDGDSAVETKGYTPSVAGFLSSRQLKLVLRTGQFTKVVQARGLFDWSSVDTANSYFDGDIQAAYYDGDGNPTYNQDGSDCHSGSLPLVPGTGGRSSNIHNRVIASDPFPIIDMTYYESRAAQVGRVWGPRLTAKIVSVTAGAHTDLVLDSDLFSDGGWASPPAAAVRDISRGHCTVDTYRFVYQKIAANHILLDDAALPVDWQPGDRISLAPRPSSVSYSSGNERYTITFPVPVFNSSDEGQAVRRLVYGAAGTIGSWEPTDWGVITDVSNNGKTVYVENPEFGGLPAGDPRRWDSSTCWLNPARLADGNVTGEQLWYIKGDLIVDVRDNAVNFNTTGVVVEGDVVIKGDHTAFFSKFPLAYPNMATKNGNIISDDLPGGGSVANRLGRRNFDDFVYSENGDVSFNYLDSKGIYGQNIYLRGAVRIAYDTSAVSTMTGFTFSLGGIKWKEQ